MISLDDIDLRLLELLQTDASLSNQDLAAAVNVSAATGLRRVRRLLEGGVIERRVALLAPSVVGGLQALAEVQLDRQGIEHLDAFEAIAVADWVWYADYPDTIRAVTPEDVRRVVLEHLHDDGLTVGLCADLDLVPLAPDVRQVFEATVRTLGAHGAHLVDLVLPEAELVYPAFGIIQRAEALDTHRRAGIYPTRRDEYGKDVRKRLS